MTTVSLRLSWNVNDGNTKPKLVSRYPDSSRSGLSIFMTDFSKTLLRCSSIGSIMANGQGSFRPSDDDKILELQLKGSLKPLTANQSKQLDALYEKKKGGELLSESCKKYLIRTYALERYNRISEEPVTKQMSKGILCEDNSIELFSFVENVYFEKNEKRVTNDFLSGTPDLYMGDDIYSSDLIVDIKSSWDISTFLKNIDGELNPSYYWQIQGYMAITGAKVGYIAYCLVNTPPEIINDEKRRLFYKMGVVTDENPEYKKEAAKIDRNMIFDDIPPEERVLRFTVERNQSDIDRIYEKVAKCRLFLAEFEKKHLFFTKNHRKESLRKHDGIRDTVDTEC